MAFHGAFRVDELTGARWKLALERLRAGERVVVLGVAVSIAEPGALSASVASAWSDPSRISAGAALSNLQEPSRWSRR